MNPDTPTIGRIVHYVSRGSADGAFPSACRAAVVAAAPRHPLPDGAVDLCVLNPTGMFFDEQIPHHPGIDFVAGDRDAMPSDTLCASGDRAYPGGTWHWPERV